MTERRNVLFLCTGNSCRSQMAEGLVNHALGANWHAFSAGMAPSGHVHPLAVQAMAEIDIDISGQRSKSVIDLGDQTYDLVVTVCDHAAENCPLWLREGEVVHIGFDDPATAIGSQEDRLVVFRRVRDEMRAQVLAHLISPHNLTASSRLHDGRECTHESQRSQKDRDNHKVLS